MEADLHAISLIALPCVTAAACCFFYRDRPSARRIAIGIGAALVAWLVQPAYFHACLKGVPFTQKLVPVLCIAPALIFIGRPLVAATAGLVLFALAPALCHQYLDLIHRDWCTGNPAWASKLNETGSTYQLEGMGNALKRIGSLDTNPRPSSFGWLGDERLLLASDGGTTTTLGLVPVRADGTWPAPVTPLQIPDAGRLAGGIKEVAADSLPGASSPASRLYILGVDPSVLYVGRLAVTGTAADVVSIDQVSLGQWQPLTFTLAGDGSLFVAARQSVNPQVRLLRLQAPR